MSLFGVKPSVGEIVKLNLATPHKFEGDICVPQDPLIGRDEQHERTCALCGLVKITVFCQDGSVRREWRLKGSEYQFTGPAPECAEVVAT